MYNFKNFNKVKQNYLRNISTHKAIKHKSKLKDK